MAKYNFEFDRQKMSNYGCYFQLTEDTLDKNSNFQLMKKIISGERNEQEQKIYLDNERGTGIVASTPGFHGRNSDVEIFGTRQEETKKRLESLCTSFKLVEA